MSSPVEDHEAYKNRLHQLDEHAVAIGHVCFAWAALELGLDQLISMLTQLDQQGDTAYAVTSNLDMRQKLEIIKAIAFIKKPSDEWFSALMETLNEIDIKIRPERNRDIHDYWLVHFPTHGETTRLKSRTRLRKSSKGEYSLSTTEEVLISAAELWDLVRAMHIVDEKLHHLWFDYGRAIGVIGGKAHD